MGNWVDLPLPRHLATPWNGLPWATGWIYHSLIASSPGHSLEWATMGNWVDLPLPRHLVASPLPGMGYHGQLGGSTTPSSPRRLATPWNGLPWATGWIYHSLIASSPGHSLESATMGNWVDLPLPRRLVASPLPGVGYHGQLGGSTTPSSPRRLATPWNGLPWATGWIYHSFITSSPRHSLESATMGNWVDLPLPRHLVAWPLPGTGYHGQLGGSTTPSSPGHSLERATMGNWVDLPLPRRLATPWSRLPWATGWIYHSLIASSPGHSLESATMGNWVDLPLPRRLATPWSRLPWATGWIYHSLITSSPRHSLESATMGNWVDLPLPHHLVASPLPGVGYHGQLGGSTTPSSPRRLATPWNGLPWATGGGILRG